MKLKITFLETDQGVTSIHLWENLDLNSVSYFHCEGLMQDLDNFLKFDQEIIENDGVKYIKSSRDTFTYEIKPKFRSYMGAHREYALSFPFSNSNEFFLGDNCIL